MKYRVQQPSGRGIKLFRHQTLPVLKAGLLEDDVDMTPSTALHDLLHSCPLTPALVEEITP